MNRFAIICGVLLAISGMPNAQASKPVTAEVCEGDDAPEMCKAARKACSKAIANAQVRKGFSANPYIRNCVADVVAKGEISDETLNNHRTMYINAARAHADSKQVKQQIRVER